MNDPHDWPVLTRYDRDHLARIALPLGGIGTGTISLGGRGDLRDWEIVNRPAKGFAPQRSFFALRVQTENGEAVTRALEGPIPPAAYEGAFGSGAANHGLPRFRDCTFEAAYPLGQVLLSDPGVPVAVRLQAFNPLIPADPERSGIPVAVLRFVIENPDDAPVQVSICGSLENFIGADGTAGAPRGNVNQFRRANGVAGIFLRSEGMDPQVEQWGTLALATTSVADVTYRTAWASLSWGDALLDFWDDFSGDGRLEERDAGGTDAPTASLATTVEIAGRAAESVTFLLAWRFPNRMTWTPAKNGEGENPNWIGNHYATRYRDAWDVALRTARELPALEDDTVAFVRAFCGGDLPAVVKEAALYNLSTLRTQTCFRTPDGHFFGWEGCGDKAGCCLGSCTHVWNYEQATAFLFGDLARSMRTVEFGHATREDGRMSFRVHLPLARATEQDVAAADGQMGCLLKLYRDWHLSGDDGFLRDLWPKARKALEFCWIPGGWDADKDGVMEGCQHNTMDVEYYGPNPQMGLWYLGALRAAEEMARYVGEEDFAAACRELFERGSRWIDDHLFNGEYYEHQVRPPESESAVAPGLRAGMGATDLADPALQLGAGCLVDQLVGQFLAHVCGLGYLVSEDHVRATLAGILRHNYRENLWSHFNHLRTFALADEAALLMATYPKGRRPRRPFPYYNEVMTGFEYTAAVGMLYEGMTEKGLKVISAIRARYDGAKRSPFDEAECGHHYARAMASWGAVLALTGFRYSAVTQILRFARANEASRQAPAPACWFWSSGYAWGTCEQNPGEDGAVAIRLHVLFGTLALRQIEIAGVGSAELPEPQGLTAGGTLSVTVRREQ